MTHRRGLFELLAVLLLLAAGPLFSAEEKLPPPPQGYVNDYAHLLSPGTVQQLDARLRQFERDSSNQIVVAIFQKLETQSSVADFAQRTFMSWKVGQAKLDNGAILFAFVTDHKTWIQTGRGLEGALPDATCARILDEELKPAFKAGNFDGGITAAVDSMIAATRGEYKGTGSVSGDGHDSEESYSFWIFAGFMLLMFVMRIFSASGRGKSFGGRRRRSGCGGMLLPMMMGSGGGWSSGGGGWSGGGGGGGFSGGGGSSGGGGAGGSW